jgi:hypothetical protein
MGLLAKAAFTINRANPAGGEAAKALLKGLMSAKGLGLLRYGQNKRDGVAGFTGSGASSVQGIVLELPGGINFPAAPRDKAFSAQVNRMVCALGTAAALPSGRCLVLFSHTLDRELLAHRLSKSLKTQALSVFAADNLEAVPDIIRPYL